MVDSPWMEEQVPLAAENLSQSGEQNLSWFCGEKADSEVLDVYR
jgi:hypothetical protein